MVEPSSTTTLPQYRTISPLAIAALLGGLASGLALVNVILFAIPLIGIFLAIAAISDIRRNAEITAGIGIARCGLFLSVFMLVFAPTRIITRTTAMKQNAELLANHTLQLIQEGRLYEVHHLTTRQFVGRDPNHSLAEYYAETPKLNETYMRFLDGDAMKKLADLNREFNFQQEDIESSAGNSEIDGFVIRYKIRPKDSDSIPFTIWIAVERRCDEKTQEAIWWLRNLQLTDPGKKK